LPDDRRPQRSERLVAPVLAQGAVQRTVVLPDGKWRADDGAEYDGAATIVVDAPLARLPWFERVRT
jgi:alpha-glucosidase